MNVLDLRKPFPPAAVSWRVGSTSQDKKKGMALAYIDARDVQDRFDEVCGPENWQCRFPLSDGKRVICEIGVRIGADWVWKADGAGDTDVEGEKGAISDAFKRAAVKWGVGRYLYDLPSPWVALEPMGRSFKIADSEHAKLRALLARDAGQHQPPAQQEPPKPVPLWERESYLLTVSGGAEKWAAKFCEAVEKAPSDTALTKLADDNDGHLKSIPEDLYKRCQEVMGKRMAYWSQHPTGKAA